MRLKGLSPKTMFSLPSSHGVTTPFLRSGIASLHQDVTLKILYVGLLPPDLCFMIVVSPSLNRRAKQRSAAVSAIEFGLTPQSPFLSTLLPMPSERPRTELGLWDHETNHLCQSAASATARLKLLTDLSSGLNGRTLQGSVVAPLLIEIRELMTSDLAFLGRSLSDDGHFEVTAWDAPSDIVPNRDSAGTLGELFWERALLTGRVWTGNSLELNQHQQDRSVAQPSFSTCVLPLIARDRILGMLVLARREGIEYTSDEIDYLEKVSSQVAILMENDLLHIELQKLKEEFGEETVCVDDQFPNEPLFEEIVGRSPALQKVLRKVEVVAPTDSGVLIQGETGTGKELIARAIHNLSGRSDKPFVKVNCAAIPSGLLESELFGHEKGAFTGAVMRKPGRFEVADKGTLFLDEVGDIPLEVQSKLLRVLQEREFERLGSTRTQQVDVRVIAATHRDLKQMVEEGTFRSDLYYRLHIFPLVVPPLRDRREDIPLVVHHFVDKYAKRMNRSIETIPAKAMETFTSYSWPGNVRELQNFIERAVILSPGSSLRAPLEELKEEKTSASTATLS